MLTCYLKRRRIGAYLDDALPEREARTMALHLAGCAACRGEAQDLGRLRDMVRGSAAVAEPDWTSFWPGIVRGIEAGVRRPDPARSDRVFVRRRAVMVGAVVAALLAVTIWQAGDSPIGPDGVTTVAVVHTEHPDGSVMVYTPPGEDMTVIWVFGLDKPPARGSI